MTHAHAAAAVLAAISGTKSLSVLDGTARAIWSDWAAGKLTDDQAATLAEMLERRKDEVRGADTVAARAPLVSAAAKAQGRPSYFPSEAQTAGFAKPAGVDRAAPDAGLFRPHAAEPSLPVHNR